MVATAHICGILIYFTTVRRKFFVAILATFFTLNSLCVCDSMFMPTGVPLAGCGNPSIASRFSDEKKIPDFGQGGREYTE